MRVHTVSSSCAGRTYGGTSPSWNKIQRETQLGVRPQGVKGSLSKRSIITRVLLARASGEAHAYYTHGTRVYPSPWLRAVPARETFRSGAQEEVPPSDRERERSVRRPYRVYRVFRQLRCLAPVAPRKTTRKSRCPELRNLRTNHSRMQMFTGRRVTPLPPNRPKTPTTLFPAFEPALQHHHTRLGRTSRAAQPCFTVLLA